MIRTGIDLGTGSVKLVRGEGEPVLERTTHLGIEDWDAAENGDDAARAAGALRRLLDRLKLAKSRLGSIAVAVGGDDASLREVVMPSLTEEELRQALPFEAQKHLNLEDYTARQSEKWIDPSAHRGEKPHHFIYDEHQNNKTKYLKLCRDAGVHPRFKDFVNEPGYMKLITDTVAADIPQKPLQPVFDYPAASRAIKKWQKQGCFF